MKTIVNNGKVMLLIFFTVVESFNLAFSERGALNLVWLMERNTVLAILCASHSYLMLDKFCPENEAQPR